MGRRFLGAALVLALVGCAAAPPPRPVVSVSPALVLRSGGQCAPEAARAAMQRVDEGAWEYGRNDQRLNAGARLPDNGIQAATIQETAWLQTSNGRPFEFSTTFIRAVTERSSR